MKIIHKRKRSKTYLVIILFIVILLIPGLYFTLQSTWEVPENDIWIRNTNQLTYTLTGPVSQTIPFTTDDTIFSNGPGELLAMEIDIGLTPNYNETLPDTCLVEFSYEIWEGSTLCQAETVEAEFQRGQAIPISFKFKRTFLHVSREYLYSIEITNITITFEDNSEFYLEQAQCLSLFIVTLCETAYLMYGFQLSRITDKDLMLTPIPPSADPEIDTDNDGVSDTDETTEGTDPGDIDTDHDGTSDYDDSDPTIPNPPRFPEPEPIPGFWLGGVIGLIIIIGGYWYRKKMKGGDSNSNRIRTKSEICCR